MQNAEKQPHGVGGWLAVLVYWLIVIGPALGFFMLLGGLSLLRQDNALQAQAASLASYIVVLDLVTWITQSGLSIYAGRRLRDRFEPASVRYAILILWFNSIGVAVLQFLALAILPSSDTASLAVFFLGRSLVLIIPVAMWNAYLVLSRRVKNTYYSVAAVAEAPAPEAPTLNQSQSPISASGEQFVLYDERFDWLAMYLIALVPLWLAYSFPVSLILFPAFALIAALKPLRLRLGSLTWSGVFAAGACLLLSPFLLMAAQDSGSDLFDDVSVRDQTLNGIRAFAYPAAGLAIMVHAWFRAPRFRDANGSIPKRIRFWRWLGFAVAGLVLAAFVAGSLLQAHQERKEYESQKKLMKLEKQREQIIKAMPLSPVTRKWLIGEWEWDNYGSCYDGLNFRASGSYSSASDSGDFELSENGRKLIMTPKLPSFCSNISEAGSDPLGLCPPPASWQVGRRGEKLIIEGAEYRRCP